MFGCSSSLKYYSRIKNRMFIEIPLIDSLGNNINLEGYLATPLDDNSFEYTKSTSLIIFTHGSGSSKNSPRNNYLAQVLNKNNITTFLFDLLTKEEEESDNKIAMIDIINPNSSILL